MTSILTDETGRIGSNPKNTPHRAVVCDAYRRSRVDGHTKVWCKQRHGLKLFNAMVEGVHNRLATLCPDCATVAVPDEATPIKSQGRITISL